MAAAGNRTGIASSFADLWNPDEPDMHGKRVVFDPQVDRRTNQLLRDWTGNRNQWKTLFNQWLSDFNAQTPEVEANVGAENQFLKWLRDGGLEAKLAGIRADEAAADKLAERNALDFADNQANFGRVLTGAPGSSSADYARRIRSGIRIADDFAQRAPARERADLASVTNIKLGTMGRINANLQALLNRQLQPQQLSDAELGALIGMLGGITNIRNAVAQPVFWREKSSSEKIGDILDTFADSAYKGANAYMTFSGLGGGGGIQSQVPAPQNYSMIGTGANYVDTRQPITSPGVQYSPSVPSWYAPQASTAYQPGGINPTWNEFGGNL